MDRTMGKELQRAMKKIGVKFHLSHGVKEVVNAGDKAIVKADNKKGEEITWEADYCLHAPQAVPRDWASIRPASPSTTAAAWRWMATCAPPTRTSTPSATW